VAAFRNIVGFAITYGAPEWVAKKGYMGTFSIFAAVIVVAAVPLPFFILYGKRLRNSSPKTGA